MLIIVESFHDSKFKDSRTKVVTYKNKDEINKDKFVKEWINDTLKARISKEQLSFIFEKFNENIVSQEFHTRYIFDGIIFIEEDDKEDCYPYLSFYFEDAGLEMIMEGENYLRFIIDSNIGFMKELSIEEI